MQLAVKRRIKSVGEAGCIQKIKQPNQQFYKKLLSRFECITFGLRVLIGQKKLGFNGFNKRIFFKEMWKTNNLMDLDIKIKRSDDTAMFTSNMHTLYISQANASLSITK